MYSSESDVDVEDVGYVEKEIIATNIFQSKLKRKRKLPIGLYQSKVAETQINKNKRRRKYIRKKVNKNDEIEENVKLNDSQSTVAYGNSSSISSIDSAISPLSSETELDENAVAENESEMEKDEKEEKTFKQNCRDKLRNSNILDVFLDILDNKECLLDFMQLIELIVSGSLDVMNIPFLLCLDLARFKSCKTTTQMLYREETKKFWLTVYRFGGGQIIRLLSGLKNFAHVCLQKCTRGNYDPNEALINFAVPDVKRITDELGQMNEPISPGFIQDCIDRVDRNKQYNLSFDGKKISPGCGQNNDGDIWLFGLECPSVQDQNQRLKEEIDQVENVLTIAKSSKPLYEMNVNMISKVMETMSHRIKDQRQTEVYQEMLKMSFEKSMSKDISTVKKCTYAISAITTYNVFSNCLVEKILHENKRICHVLSKMRKNEENFVQGDFVQFENQPNIVTLKPPDKIIQGNGEVLKPEYTKQGTNEWKTLRKEAYITASTAHAALGMDTLKKQMMHFKEFVTKEMSSEVTNEMQRMFDHGRQNEPHAFATLAGIILPALLPNCKKITQVGSFFMNGDNKDKLAIISPDGYITDFGKTNECIMGEHGLDEDYSVELKAPMGERKNVLPVHYTVPIYYIPQLLFQMKVLNVCKALYASYSKQSTTVILVNFDDKLWNDMWALTKKMYDHVNLTKLVKCVKESKEIKEQMREFTEKQCTFILEIPSLMASEGLYLEAPSESPFRMGMPSCRPTSSEDEVKEILIDACNIILDLIHQCYEMQRKKATELMMLIINDLDRMFNNDHPYSMPVAWCMKGYSLDVKKMRQIVNIVMDKLIDEGISVQSQSFDGQWFNMAVRTEDQMPLTKLQLQKAVWSQLGRITKDNLLKKISTYTNVLTTDLDSCASSRFLTVGEFTYGNLHVSFENKMTLEGRVASPNKRHLVATCMGNDSNMEKIMCKIHTPSSTQRPDLWMDEDIVLESTNENEGNIQLQGNMNFLTLLPQQFLQDEQMVDAADNAAQGATGTVTATAFQATDTSQVNNNTTATAFTSRGTRGRQLVLTPEEFERRLLTVNKSILQEILIGLLGQKRTDKWKSYEIEDLLHNVLRNQKQIESLTSYELDVINNVFQCYTKRQLFKGNALKSHKVKVVCKLFGRKRQANIEMPKNTRRITLRKLCNIVIRDIDYPTNVLAVALANCFHWPAKELWKNSATMPMRIQLPESQTIHECYSYLEYVAARNQVEFQFLDPTHILTNIRTHICNRGYTDIQKDVFLRVSESNNDILNRAYVQNCLDKQSAPIAMQFFGLPVQSQMFENGDVAEADIVGIIRNWYRAVDERGLSVPIRCALLQDMFDWLTAKIKFDVYPPPTQYICGIPIVTFESILHNISSRLQFFFIAKGHKYNQRSLSTLAIETLFGHMSRMQGSYNGCPKATMIPYLLKILVQLDHLCYDPDKVFTIHTTHRKKYPDHLLLSSDTNTDTCTTSESDEEADAFSVRKLKFKNHKFDKKPVRTRKKRTKISAVSTGNKTFNREGGVRQYFKAVDSRIKSTTRHGLPD